MKTAAAFSQVLNLASAQAAGMSQRQVLLLRRGRSRLRQSQDKLAGLQNDGQRNISGISGRRPDNVSCRRFYHVADMTLQQQLAPFCRNRFQTGIGLAFIVTGLLISVSILAELLRSERFNGASIVAIIATAIITVGILILDAIRCKG